MEIDSFGIYLIEVSLGEGLVGWKEVFQEVVIALVQWQYLRIYKCQLLNMGERETLYEGASWSKFSWYNEKLWWFDRFTIVYVVAAMSDHHSLSAVYGMMRMGPSFVWYDVINKIE